MRPEGWRRAAAVPSGPLPAGSKYRKSLTLEGLPGGGRIKKGQEGESIGIGRSGRNCDGIYDRRMGVLGEPVDDFNGRLGGRVGFIDNSQRRLAACDQHKRRAHVLDLGDLAFDALPGAELLKRGLAVFSGRDGIDI